MTSSRSDWDIDEQRLTALSVLQELTAAALDLFVPVQPVDDFLERLATRLLARAALCIEERVERETLVLGAAGLSRASRSMPPVVDAPPSPQRDWSLVAFTYPEVNGPKIARWTFELGAETAPAVRWTLLLFFDGEPSLPVHYRGMVKRLAGYLFTALTHREMLAREQSGRMLAEHARQRSEFLAEASHALSGSLEHRFNTEGVARLVVPRFGDWCTIDVFDRNGTIRRLGAAHRSPEYAALIEQFERLTPEPGSDEGVPRVMRSGRTAVYTNIREAQLRADAPQTPPLGTRDEGQLEIARKLGMSSYLVLPLVARGSTLGAVACGAVEPGRAYDRDEIALAEELARRISLWLDNAHLVEDLRASVEELGRAQTELVQRERLAALGELAATVAHEVRNPLGAMANSVSSLRRLIKPEGDAATLLRVLEEENSRLNRIVADLLDFSRPSEPTLYPEPLPAVIEAALDAAQRASGDEPRIEVQWDVSDDLPLVRIDARLVQMVFSNLFANAIQAMPDGGKLDIGVARLRDASGGCWAEVRIRDSGSGIAPDVQQRLFEPFFTTRATGTGLGLAIVKRIVDSHRGQVAVESTLGEGTTMVVRLPYEASECP